MDPKIKKGMENNQLEGFPLGNLQWSEAKEDRGGPRDEKSPVVWVEKFCHCSMLHRALCDHWKHHTWSDIRIVMKPETSRIVLRLEVFFFHRVVVIQDFQPLLLQMNFSCLNRFVKTAHKNTNSTILDITNAKNNRSVSAINSPKTKTTHGCWARHLLHDVLLAEWTNHTTSLAEHLVVAYLLLLGFWPSA